MEAEMQMSIDSLEHHAAWFQRCAAADARLAMAFNPGDAERAIDWQHFAAEASATARKYLFELIDRKAGK